ncbi:MAG: SBBP repeat-containing protein [Verrucomicrobia bacterium]|nr:SBBP repeat-containing protein [Verrucomicrobiota bacterium]
MRLVRWVVLLLASFFTVSAQAFFPSSLAWGRALGGTGTDLARAVAVDGDGFVYAVGSFSGSVQFGATNLAASGQQDLFIARFAPSGELIWARQAGGLQTDAANAVGWDPAGFIYVGGSFTGTAAFGTTNLIATGGGSDAFVAKLTLAGEFLWVRKLGGAGDDFANDVALDSAGKIYVTGSLNSTGAQSLFLACFDQAGQGLWTNQISGQQVVRGQKIALDAGGIYVAGQLSGAAIIAGQPVTSAGDYDVLLVKYSSTNGTPLWATNCGGSAYDFVQGLAVSAGGQVHLCGGFSGNATFGSTNITAQSAGDFFLAAISAAGAVQWVRSAPEASGSGLIVTTNDTLYVAGTFTGTLTLGSLSATATNGTFGSFLAAYSTDGTAEKLFHWQSTDFAVPLALAAVTGDAVLVGGYFGGNLNVAGSTLDNPGGAGSLDAFLFRLEPPAFRLRAEVAGNSLRLAWPAIYTNAILQVKSDLGIASAWSDVSSSVSVLNEESVVLVPVENQRNFFHLRR